MEDCYEIKSQPELQYLIKKNGLSFINDCSKLSKNQNALIYRLKDGTIIIVSGATILNSKGLLVKDNRCLSDLLKSDLLPVENPEKVYLEDERENIKDIVNKIPYFINHLNIKTGLKFESIDKNNYSLYHDYLVNSRNKKNEYDPKDDIALLVVASEIVRKERNGKWMLIKRDAVYNPYYEPAIYLENDEYISMEFAALHSLSNGILFDKIYMKDLFKEKPRGKVKEDFKDESDYVIFK